MKAEVQRLTADNEVLRVGKRLAEQTRDKLRKEVEALKKQASVVMFEAFSSSEIRLEILDLEA